MPFFQLYALVLEPKCQGNGLNQNRNGSCLTIPSPIIGWWPVEKLSELRPYGRFVEISPPIKWHQVFPEAFLLFR
jgi:hypothetical protein